MLFARWQHHIRFGSGFPYAPFKAMLTKISKWSRIQDSFRIAPRIESLVVFAIPDIPSKFQKNPYITFWVILLTHRQTDRETNKLWQKHNLLGGGNKYLVRVLAIALLTIVKTCDQKHFTITELSADRHELTIPQRTMRPSTTRVSKRLDPRCSTQTYHCFNQLH